MHILHILNVADWFLMAVGLAVALAMMVVNGHDERRDADAPPRRNRR